jgi:hypothetical protein
VALQADEAFLDTLRERKRALGYVHVARVDVVE